MHQKADIHFPPHSGGLNVGAAVSVQTDTGGDVWREAVLAGKWRSLERLLFPSGLLESVFPCDGSLEVVSGG